MKLFNDKKDGNIFDSQMSRGNYGDMLKMREKELPDMQKNIEQAFEHFHGQNVVVIIMEEDENGEPTGHRMVMTGVGTMQNQIALGKALHKASHMAIEALMEGAKGDLRATLEVAQALSEELKED